MFDSVEKKLFSINSDGASIIGDYCQGEGEPVLCLHGAGASTRYQFDPLRQELWSNKIPSISFDFVGHGETGGILQSSSLKHRFEQVCHVIEEINLKEPLSVIAESMSGYTAIKLLEKYELKNLILFVPAVYHSDSYAMPFNQGFSEIIRKPKSWIHSDAWNILQTFRGNLLICFAENDAVIPQEIIDRLYDSAKNAQSRNLYLISGSPHKTWEYLDQNKLERERLFKRVIETLKA